MKLLHSELALSQVELKAKDETCVVAHDYIISHIGRFKGIKNTVTVTHSWAKNKLYADPRYAYTCLVACDAKVELSALVGYYKQMNKLFKNCGKPNLYWHRKGILLAVGFTVNQKQMTQLNDLFS